MRFSHKKYPVLVGRTRETYSQYHRSWRNLREDIFCHWFFSEGRIKFAVEGKNIVEQAEVTLSEDVLNLIDYFTYFVAEKPMKIKRIREESWKEEISKTNKNSQFQRLIHVLAWDVELEVSKTVINEFKTNLKCSPAFNPIVKYLKNNQQ